ncbi:acinetodin/klebsidin/J25 family lasso peptide [Achromobacter sp. RTa]|uniref:acinetodin/klebsidin/J25 family lasso peptide n=1 Tax=Achromobacter sp. RTa TaxID=1532557 RepID=UPI0012E0C01C|nr:acinetodin/klebsidin/J25 family lasso peptide [Achromobacter sp. RTa]
MQRPILQPQPPTIQVIKLEIPASKLTQGGSGGIPEYFYAPDPMGWKNPNVTKYG